jgi:uncharacterized membrane protein YphA (DoxX/SURF4 family)
MTNSHINQIWWSLRLTYGSVAFLAGLDKFFGLLADWEQYLAPAVAAAVPVSASTLMQVFGVVEMAVGVLILTSWTRLGAYIASAWLAGIALNLVAAGAYFDVAVRDAAMSVGAWALARLSELRQPAEDRIASRATPAPARG